MANPVDDEPKRFVRFMKDGTKPDSFSKMPDIGSLDTKSVFENNHVTEIQAQATAKLDGDSIFGSLVCICSVANGKLVPIQQKDGHLLLDVYLHKARPLGYRSIAQVPADQLFNEQSKRSSHEYTPLPANVVVRTASGDMTMLNRVRKDFMQALRNMDYKEPSASQYILCYASFRAELISSKRLRAATSLLLSASGFGKSSVSFTNEVFALVLLKGLPSSVLRESYVQHYVQRFLTKYSEIVPKQYTIFDCSNDLLQCLPNFKVFNRTNPVDTCVYKLPIMVLDQVKQQDGTVQDIFSKDITAARWEKFKRDIYQFAIYCEQRYDLEGLVLQIYAYRAIMMFVKVKPTVLLVFPKSFCGAFGQLSKELQQKGVIDNCDAQVHQFWDAGKRLNYTAWPSLNAMTYTEPNEAHIKGLEVYHALDETGFSRRMGAFLNVRKTDNPLQKVQYTASQALINLINLKSSSVSPFNLVLATGVRVGGTGYSTMQFYVYQQSQDTIWKSTVLNQKPFGPYHEIPFLVEEQGRVARNATFVYKQRYHDYIADRFKFDIKNVNTSLKYVAAFHLFFVFLFQGSVEDIVQKLCAYWRSLSAMCRRMALEIIISSYRYHSNGTTFTHEDYHPFCSLFSHIALKHKNYASLEAELIQMKMRQFCVSELKQHFDAYIDVCKNFKKDSICDAGTTLMTLLINAKPPPHWTREHASPDNTFKNVMSTFDAREHLSSQGLVQEMNDFASYYDFGTKLPDSTIRHTFIYNLTEQLKTWPRYRAEIYTELTAQQSEAQAGYPQIQKKSRTTAEFNPLFHAFNRPADKSPHTNGTYTRRRPVQYAVFNGRL
ncbi:MAG: hypothetical protein CMF24_08660 [Ilumatobacter sp.]|nr:hypothetical protein [Ilumatobacter sp.]|tara:strand:+ start:918 stop:3410 length:2493 start_codon:yes stop_codon:yes gene_type:complete